MAIAEAEAGKEAAFVERAACLQELFKLGRIMCRDCGGRGHSHRYCINRYKLTELGKRNRICGEIVSGAREVVEAANKVTMQAYGNPPTGKYSMLPNSKKRADKKERRAECVIGKATILGKRRYCFDE